VKEAGPPETSNSYSKPPPMGDINSKQTNFSLISGNWARAGESELGGKLELSKELVIGGDRLLPSAQEKSI